MNKFGILLFALSMPLFACGGGGGGNDVPNAPADTYVPPSGDAAMTGPMCNSISGEFAMTGMKIDPDNCPMPAAGDTIMGTMTISNVTAMGFDMTITPAGGTPAMCSGNLNTTTCVFMGLCGVPGEMGAQAPVEFTIANNNVTGNIVIGGANMCRTTYRLTGTRN